MGQWSVKIAHYLRERDRGRVLALIVAVCLVYLPFLASPFVFDDATFLQEEGSGRDTYALSNFLYPRWLPNASLHWTFLLFSSEMTHAYHLGNLLLHAANVIVLFYFIRQLGREALGHGRQTPEIVWGAWFAALIFAIHPVAVYAVGYVIERSILMATLFALLMQMAYLRGLLTGKARWMILAVLAYFLACSSKEQSVMTPALLLAMTILLRNRNQAGSRALLLTWGAFVSIALFTVWRARGVVASLYEMGKDSLIDLPVAASASTLHWYSALTQAGLFFKYLLLLLLPNPGWMSIDMREHFVTSSLEWQAWLGAIAFLAYGALAIWLLFRKRWIGFVLLYPWLQFWLEFSTIRVQEIFVLYRAYLWLPGVLLAIPMLLHKWPGKRTVVLLGFAVLLLLPSTLNRLWVFADDYRLWNDAAKLLTTDKGSLNTDRIYYSRARAAAYARDWTAAASDYELVVEHRPNMPLMHYGLGVAYFNLGRYEDALAQFDAAIRLDANYAIAYYNKAMTLKMLHKNDAALQQLKKSCELKYALACFLADFPTRGGAAAH